MTFQIKAIQAPDHSKISEIVNELWGNEIIIVHGDIFHTLILKGLKALIDDQIIGFFHYQRRNKECEILTLASLKERQGVGSALTEAVEKIAREDSCRVLSVITINDNLHALGFYQRRGNHLAALYPGSVNASKKKPTIPDTGDNNIPIRDELRLEKLLS
ncbi:MAG: GNAT family N-acetyltransferase [Chloroflexota bacterium]|nr:GNAT family N-acetyltransferase [Chloroflexota bacterium]